MRWTQHNLPALQPQVRRIYPGLTRRQGIQTVMECPHLTGEPKQMQLRLYNLIHKLRKEMGEEEINLPYWTGQLKRTTAIMTAQQVRQNLTQQ